MRIGAGWKKKTKDGQVYLSCKMEALPFNWNGQFTLWQNTEKEAHTLQPDYYISYTEPRHKDQNTDSGGDVM